MTATTGLTPQAAPDQLFRIALESVPHLSNPPLGTAVPIGDTQFLEPPHTLEVQDPSVSVENNSSFMQDVQAPPLIYHQPCPNPPPARRPQTLSNAAVFAQKIMNVAKKMAIRPDNLSSRSLMSLTANDLSIANIASTAVQVIGALANLDTYIYPTVSVGDSTI